MTKVVTIDWPILSGSVTTARSRCGKPGCVCKDDASPRLHGTYYRWTGFIQGKRTTKTIDKEAAEECKRRIRSFRKFQRQINLLLAEAFQDAPWQNKIQTARRRKT